MSAGEGGRGAVGAGRDVARAYGAAVLALLFWSGTAIANKFAVAEIDPLGAGLLRSSIAGMIALAAALALRMPFPSSTADRRLLVISGLSCFAAWPVLMSLGIARTSAGHAALIMATIPVFTVLIATLVEGRMPRRIWWLGAAIAFAGAVAIVVGRGSGFAESNVDGDLLIFAGGFVCSIGYVAGGKLSARLGTAATTFWGLAVALVVVAPLFFLVAGRTAWAAVSGVGWLALGWLTLFSSLAGYVLWFYALGRGGIARMGTLQLATPVVTLMAARVLLDEPLTAVLVAACAMVMAGTLLAQGRA